MIYQSSLLQRDQSKRGLQQSQQSQQSQQTQQQNQTSSTSQAQLQQQLQYREALIARAKLNSKKGFSVEDDFEFYPNFVESRQVKSQLSFSQQSHHLLGRQSISPYSTPTKLSTLRLNQQNHNGFLSTLTGQSQQQSPQQYQSQIQQANPYSSPSSTRRVDHQNTSSNSMYQNNNW